MTANIDYKPDIVDLPEREAEAKLLQDGYQMRIVSYEGKPCIVTADWRTDRYNVIIKNGKVSGVWGVG